MASPFDTANAAAESAAEAERRIRDEAEILHRDLDLGRRAYLISKGISFDVAMGFSAAELTAWTVAFGEADGARFDWDKNRWARI